MELFEQLWAGSGLAQISLGQAAMIAVSLLLLYLAVAKKFEPLLLVTIGFGGLLSNIPGVEIATGDGLLHLIYLIGIETGAFPLLIFMGVGAMTDFGPVLANPKTFLLGAAAQFGIVFHGPQPWKHLVNLLLSFPLIVKNNLRGFSGCFALNA